MDHTNETFPTPNKDADAHLCHQGPCPPKGAAWIDRNLIEPRTPIWGSSRADVTVGRIELALRRPDLEEPARGEFAHRDDVGSCAPCVRSVLSRTLPAK